MAPEILEGKNKYGYACDLWSIGIIIYQLFFKEYPYKGGTQVAIYKQIEELGKKVLKTTKNEKLDNLINSLLIRDPEKRINYEEYFKHPFFKENYVKINSIHYNKVNINLRSRNMRKKTKTNINLQKEPSIINNNETLNYNNSPLKTDANQSFMPKQNQKNIKKYHLLSSIIKQSAFNILKKNEISSKIQPKKYQNKIKVFLLNLHT
jgi:serine/threonine protein kinase